MAYVEFNVSDDVVRKVWDLLEIAHKRGKVRRGANETIKSIERGQAKLVIIASDVDPEAIVIPVISLAKEKKIPYLFVPSKAELGRYAGIQRPASAVAIEKPGSDEAEALLEEIVKSIEGFLKGVTSE